MKVIPSLLAALTVAAFAAPGISFAGDSTGTAMRMAQAGPPTSGWGAPGAAPAPAASPGAAPPPSSGWAAPGAPAGAPGPAPMMAPMAPPPGAGTGWSGGGGGGGGRDCGGEFMPLRADAEKKAAAIKAAAATKQQPAVCAAFRNFAAAEAKVIKYVEEHGAECRIPPDAAKMLKTNHAKTLEIRTKVCDTASNPQPRMPSLSDALGTSRVPTAPQENTLGKRSGSTFDTLTGNSLNR